MRDWRICVMLFLFPKTGHGCILKCDFFLLFRINIRLCESCCDICICGKLMALSCNVSMNCVSVICLVRFLNIDVFVYGCIVSAYPAYICVCLRRLTILSL